ncbi:hypothetical protein DXB50_13695 [Butyricicoccus sp. OM04-18BH]|nr:hypothetical protein DXB50_13695 [Butyricicoccus sp. OM04-18BH]
MHLNIAVITYADYDDSKWDCNSQRSFQPFLIHLLHLPKIHICCHLHYTSLPIKKIAYFMKLVGWEQLATQDVPRWQVHKRVGRHISSTRS